MIVFHVVSAMPKELTESDLRRLGQFLGQRLRRKRPQEVGVRFVTPAVIQKLNKTYRRINRPTDVLSFDAGETRSALSNPRYLGDLVICPSYARGEARRRGMAPKEELVRLLAHGILHLAGYDHATEHDESRMFALQETIVQAVSADL
jgi:probable rRNA maturation factor